MRIYALVGPSGTGKSHRAMLVAHQEDIEVIIDDGLLIKNGRKLAGRSAKREATTFAAVKRAIFLEAAHAEEVRSCLKELQPEKVLVLGTSLHMINRIAATLELPFPVCLIRIEEIATPREIKMARELRTNHGMHVIPVPAIELKADFPGYLLDSLKYFLQRKNDARRKIGEKSILRPKFSLNGKLAISETVIMQLTSHFVLTLPQIEKVNRVEVDLQSEGVVLNLEITARYPANLPDLAQQIRQTVRLNLEDLTGLVVYAVDVFFKAWEY
jgi:ABC-type dipeptide/oligopeptide/nickel transport system ATPase component